MNAKLRRHVLQKYLDLNKEKKKWCWTRSLFVKFVKQKIGAPDSSLLFPTFQPGWKIMFQMCYQRQKPHRRPEAEVSGGLERRRGRSRHLFLLSWADATAFTKRTTSFLWNHDIPKRASQKTCWQDGSVPKIARLFSSPTSAGMN